MVNTILKRISFLFFFLAVQSCSNNNFEERLAGSFDMPLSEEKKEEKMFSQKKESSNKDKAIAKKESRPKKIKTRVNSKTKVSMNKSKPSLKRSIFNPQPYRVTIKLSGTNPAAPAETVTNALIKAGVNFEVEKIEKIQSQESSKSAFRERR